MTQCFWIEQSGKLRYVAAVECKDGHRTVLAEREGMRPDLPADHDEEWAGVQIDGDDVEWPAFCPACEAALDYENDHPQRLGGNREWTRRDTGETHWNVRDFGPGAMWDADWMPSAWKRGGDGRYLVVLCPDGHEWTIDSEASNCTRKGEDHDCWCRHGEPPNLTVDKTPEPGRSTCAAGAGSIKTPSWHGFLRNGRLVEV